jgi:hypothetical protein
LNSGPDSPIDPGPDPEAPPPVLGSWRKLYAVVIGALVLWILLFILFEKFFQ